MHSQGFDRTKDNAQVSYYKVQTNYKGAQSPPPFVQGANCTGNLKLHVTYGMEFGFLSLTAIFKNRGELHTSDPSLKSIAWGPSVLRGLATIFKSKIAHTFWFG